jgi:hypothetical protein
MDAKKASELVNTIRPEVALSTHYYGSMVGKPNDGEVFAQYVKVSDSGGIEILR